jgi:hypothetical protein
LIGLALGAKRPDPAFGAARAASTANTLGISGRHLPLADLRDGRPV